MNATELQRAAERTFGSLWDALGFAPWRELQQTATTLAAAQAREVTAQADYLRIAAAAFAQAGAALAPTLAERESRGDEATSPTALLRLWLGELDAAMHAAMLSEQGLAATAATVRATSERRLAQQRLVEIGSEAAGLPTRSHVDAAYREIQQLKREVRKLRQAARQENRS